MHAYSYIPRSEDEMITNLVQTLLKGNTIKMLTLSDLLDAEQEVEYTQAFHEAIDGADPYSTSDEVDTVARTISNNYVEEWRANLDNDPEKLKDWLTTRIELFIETQTIQLEDYEKSLQETAYDYACDLELNCQEGEPEEFDPSN